MLKVLCADYWEMELCSEILCADYARLCFYYARYYAQHYARAAFIMRDIMRGVQYIMRELCAPVFSLTRDPPRDP